MTRRLLQVLLAALLLVAGLLLTSTPAFAAGNGVRNGYSLALNSWPIVLAGICGWGSTQLTALLTNRAAPQWVKSGLHLALSTLAGILITVTIVPGKRWTDYVSEIAASWISGIVVHVAGGTRLAEQITANSGVGASVQPLVKPRPGKKAA